MAWSKLDIDKPHLAYIILGGFTGLFMLCSLFVKEKLYMGEATVATICGLIFGPHAADLFTPTSWGNVDKITLECSRIVLVVQCFAIGVELPKYYMERHWKSVVLLLVPVMTWGWLISSLFIWWLVPRLNWLDGLVCAACITATDPILASSIVGKGKFAKRVPKHLRDLLSAESGCNDGMAFPFIYLSLYILHYRPNANQVAFHWFCLTILYECVLGAFFGFMVGYIARHMIRFAEEKSLIDRESFLVFYFVLALFCAGCGSLLGMDDLLIGFAAGVGFSNDGWFTRKTEESHVSNVIDLLLNLAYFVYFGSIVPWQEFNSSDIGLSAWRLVVIAIFIILFRRIPIMLLLKPIIPDVKSWREALFAGHFGPIGVGAIFASILAKAELETDSTQPLSSVKHDAEHYDLIVLIWPITTFIVISSIIVHGSSIAVFTLGKRINTLSFTMSYTTNNDDGPSWMNRLPRLSSARSSLSTRREMPHPEEKDASGTLPPIGLPFNILRRQQEDDTEANGKGSSAWPSRGAPRRRKRKSAGGRITASAITPIRNDSRIPHSFFLGENRERIRAHSAPGPVGGGGGVDRRDADEDEDVDADADADDRSSADSSATEREDIGASGRGVDMADIDEKDEKDVDDDDDDRDVDEDDDDDVDVDDVDDSASESDRDRYDLESQISPRQVASPRGGNGSSRSRNGGRRQQQQQQQQQQQSPRSPRSPPQQQQQLHSPSSSSSRQHIQFDRRADDNQSGSRRGVVDEATTDKESAPGRRRIIVWHGEQDNNNNNNNNGNGTARSHTSSDDTRVAPSENGGVPRR